ncbi:sugar nucleotide-binding protein [Oscillospiraceae bacterium 38-13]
MKILVIGAGGMVGYTMFHYLHDLGYCVTGITKTKFFPNMLCMDATDEQAMRRLLEQEAFDAVINCAALLLKPSEERKSEAVRLNSWLPHFLDAYCVRKNTYLIQVSTDAVFSGQRENRMENSLCDADTFYGKSKLLGEVSNDHALTVRSGFWGVDVNSEGMGLLQWFLRQSGRVSGYSRAIFNGVSNLEFARFADAAIQNRWTGVYHLHASEPISKYEFLCLAKRVFSSETEIVEDTSVSIDRSLQSIRTDIPYKQRSYAQMMDEMKNWQSMQH